MFLTIKIKTIALVCAFALVAIGLSFALSMPAASVVSNGKVIVIDAGHGGRDGGVIGVNTGSKESDINLVIAKAAESFLKQNGYKVILTRKNSEGLYSTFSKNKKLSDMNKRKEIINSACPDLVVSIHQNSFPGKSISGAQVFYSANAQNSKSQEIAQVFQSTFNGALSGKRVAAEGDYYILQCSSYPSVLVECGFLSNAEEEKLLISSEYQQRLGYIIFSAIHTYLDDKSLVSMLYK